MYNSDRVGAVGGPGDRVGAGRGRGDRVGAGVGRSDPTHTQLVCVWEGGVCVLNVRGPTVNH